MIGIGIRVSIIVLLTIGVVRSSVWIYHTIYDLLDFQITLYRYLLSTQESISNIKTTASGSWNSFMQSIGVGTDGKAELLTQNSISVNQQLATFTNKIELISALISGVVGLLLWKLLFDSIFGIKSLISRIVSFIHEPVEKKSMGAPM